jgi:NitT/TauT family transport system substrate-binding protein
LFWQHYRHLNPRRQLAVCLAVAALVSSAGCSAAADDNASRAVDTVTYLTAFGSFGRESFVYVAKQKGFFAQRGIQVNIKAGQGATSNLQLLSAGQAQFSANDLGGVWILQGNGKFPQVRAVAAIQQRTLNSIMTLQQSGITGPKDLIGRKLGGTAGATPELLWPVYAKLTGIDPKAVTWVHMAAQQTPVALAAGKVDGIGQFTVASGTVEKAAGGRKTRALAYSDVIADLYGNGLVTTTTVIHDNPDLVARFRDALLEGLVWSVQHPQDAGQILHQQIPAQNAAAAAGELEKMAPYVFVAGQAGVLDPGRVARAVAILAGAGAITARTGRRIPGRQWGTMTMTVSPYVYSNAHTAAEAQHQRLSQILDPGTRSRLCGLHTPLPGAACLEVGAGGGSIAVWLAEQVGPDGQVLAVDIAPRPMPVHPRLQVRQHDITTGVPAGQWDVIHARLTLMHVPDRIPVLHMLASALTPGGALVVEDWDQTWLAGRVLRAPSAQHGALWTRFNDALINVFVEAGVDPGWASRAPAVMTDAGMVDVSATVRCESWTGGSAGALLGVSSIAQLRERLLGEGLSHQDLDEVSALMHNPQLMIRLYPLVQTVGYRPPPG